MERDTVIAGPIGATIYATSTRPDVELIATLEDIHPDGQSTPFTSGALLGSFRALDNDLSWFAADGAPLLPHHPYTQASVTPVPVGEVTRFDVEVFSTFAQIAKGHRLRFTLTTSDTPHVLPTAAQSANLAGGVYQVQRNSANASHLTLSTAPADAFGHCFSFTPAAEGRAQRGLPAGGGGPAPVPCPSVAHRAAQHRAGAARPDPEAAPGPAAAQPAPHAPNPPLVRQAQPREGDGRPVPARARATRGHDRRRPRQPPRAIRADASALWRLTPVVLRSAAASTAPPRGARA